MKQTGLNEHQDKARNRKKAANKPGNEADNAGTALKPEGKCRKVLNARHRPGCKEHTGGQRRFLQQAEVERHRRIGAVDEAGCLRQLGENGMQHPAKEQLAQEDNRGKDQDAPARAQSVRVEEDPLQGMLLEGPGRRRGEFGFGGWNGYSLNNSSDRAAVCMLIVSGCRAQRYVG